MRLLGILYESSNTSVQRGSHKSNKVPCQRLPTYSCPVGVLFREGISTKQVKLKTSTRTKIINGSKSMFVLYPLNSL
jgi:hypothetical protein